VGFEPTISVRELPQIYALDRAATGTGTLLYTEVNLINNVTTHLSDTFPRIRCLLPHSTNSSICVA
jgi:hypothetical protein